MKFSLAGKEAANGQTGFTLIELLTTVSIIGILSAIASSHFQSYTVRALDARAQNDLSNAVTAEEALYTSEERYVACTNGGCRAVLPGYLLSPDTQLEIVVSEADQVYQATAYHPHGDMLYSLLSTDGRLVAAPRP